jgi:hypothetical protein
VADVVRFRRPRLPLVRPRRLGPAEVAALKARPWPRLPWWLWLAVVVTTVATVVVALSLVRQGGRPAPVGVGALRPPPAGQLSHGVGAYRVPVFEPANARLAVRRHAGCPRLANLTLVGSVGEVDLLSRAADQTCALRSTPAIERARAGLNRPGVQVVFAEFQVGSVESSTVLGRRQATVLITGAYSRHTPQRIAALLVHEGSHLAAGRAPTAADELAARTAELQACQRLFPAGGAARPNHGCLDAAELLAGGDANALAALHRAGYR